MFGLVCLLTVEDARPTFRWEKVGGQLPDRAQVHGNELIIPSISSADEGTYRCHVSIVTDEEAAEVEEVSYQVVITVEG